MLNLHSQRLSQTQKLKYCQSYSTSSVFYDCTLAVVCMGIEWKMETFENPRCGCAFFLRAQRYWYTKFCFSLSPKIWCCALSSSISPRQTIARYLPSRKKRARGKNSKAGDTVLENMDSTQSPGIFFKDDNRALPDVSGTTDLCDHQDEAMRETLDLFRLFLHISEVCCEHKANNLLKNLAHNFTALESILKQLKTVGFKRHKLQEKMKVRTLDSFFKT